jgi:hypothetical protein
MKYRGLFIIPCLFFILPAQGQYRKSIAVNAGEDMAQAFSPNGFYRFPQFSQGALFSRKRSGNSAQLFNYNLLDDKILFINREGDTLVMANPTLFDSVRIDNRTFYYREDAGFLEVVASSPVMLVKKTIIKIKPQSVGAYDGNTTTSAINKINTYMVGTNRYNYTVNENVVLKETVDWFWIDGNGNLVKASRKNFLSLLTPGKKTAAEAVIRQKKTDFDKESDLVEMLSAL